MLSLISTIRCRNMSSNKEFNEFLDAIYLDIVERVTSSYMDTIKRFNSSNEPKEPDNLCTVKDCSVHDCTPAESATKENCVEPYTIGGVLIQGDSANFNKNEPFYHPNNHNIDFLEYPELVQNPPKKRSPLSITFVSAKGLDEDQLQDLRDQIAVALERQDYCIVTNYSVEVRQVWI